MSGAERHDLILFGATSFVGRLVCHYLVEHYGCGGEVRWAIAGRSRDKLEALRAELGATAEQLAIVVADAGDATSLRTLCEQTRVVVSTVGPYALYGEPLVEACADTGTDYCDLTGEVHWMRAMIQRHEARARASGARIVHACGFDSVPSDLGVHYLQALARERSGAPCQRVKLRIKGARGGFSGGTVASLLNGVRQMRGDPALRRQMADPYSLCPPDHGFSARQPKVGRPARDPDFDAWLAPFIMAGVNTRVVHRSNALLSKAYGQEFRYDEAMLMGRGWRGRLRANGLALGLLLFGAALLFPPTRWLLSRWVLPAPGDGPDAAAREAGFFDIRLHGATVAGEAVGVRVSGDRDPGYGATAGMLAEAALCLALDVDRRAVPGGFWTPASALGEALRRRLPRAGVRIEAL